MKRVVVLAVAASSLLAACATETVPACRAPQAHEMAAFAAIISHNETAVSETLAPSALRNAFIRRDPLVRAWVWGAPGETGGTLVGMLSQPPLCIIDDPRIAATETVRQVLVYPQANFSRVAPPATTPLADAPPPYGTAMRDFLSCRFEQTADGWKLADMCGYRMPGSGGLTGL
ncbi:hypothetical protein [Maricaulis salignorans]|uniref:Lipoprotein n=1 Tax=Maricaulis salignorans TaxID=144026 RepID=A0A1G9W3L6_9PROT|nr:hypothetical protein [Maricaulis salignorans]SDM79162.1 hypothetical protein SAMN04488568_12226 [Maricaulis salignorans]